MLVEIPSFRRCCCCLPLRRGILTFAYLNLLITIFFGVLQLLLWLIFFSNMKNHTVGMYRGVVIEAHMFFVIALHVLDIVFTIVLIVGAHMFRILLPVEVGRTVLCSIPLMVFSALQSTEQKSCKLMRVYYYYQMTTMIANFLVMLVTYSDSGNSSWEAVISELAVAFLGFVVQIYLLLLIHSELNKQRYQEGRTSFVNQMSEVYLEPPLRQDRISLL